jgi:hypothetical protein
MVSLTLRPLYIRKPPVCIIEKGGLVPEPIWTLWSRENFMPLPGTKPWPSIPLSVAIATELHIGLYVMKI